MKLFSSERPLSHARAVSCALTNQLAAPGLGSLMAGRWVAGSGQFVLSIASCVVLTVWVLKTLTQYYNIPSGFSASETQAVPINWKPCVASAILMVVAWLWSAVTSFSLLRETSMRGRRSLEKFALPPVQRVDEAKIIIALSALPQWRRDGEVISRVFEFPDFVAAMKFVNHVADLAEQAQHHPDIDVRWNKVTLALTTHDAKGLTEKDFALAKQCDALAKF